jgi:RHS repeat-associated protein
VGRPAAKKGDKIISATPGDIHIVQPPFGPPVPLPHPCKSDIKMKLAKQVNVQGKPGAMKGSKSKHMPPHFPTPPGVSFMRPPKNEAEVFTASSNVNYEGRGAAMLGDTGLMCCDPTDMPVGVLVVPPGTVYVGGGISGGAEARAQAKIAAMRAAAAACHQWVNDNMPLGADREEAHRRVCEATGHPVDVATGKVFTGVVVLRLRGRIPVRFALDYSTARAQEDGSFGHGWRHELERHLLITDDFIAHRNQHGHFAAFAPIGPGETAQNLADGLTLHHHGHYLTVRDAGGLEDLFLLPEGYQKGWILPLAGIRDAFRNSVRLHYQDRRLAAIVDSAGREVQFTYGDGNRVIQVLRKDDPRLAPQPIVTCRYDRAGDLVAVGDPLGHERRFAYDHHLLVQETDRNGFSFYFAYDEAQRCVLTWGDGGKLYRRLAYDPERQLTHVVDSYGGQTLYRLSTGGRVEDRIDPLGREWSKVLDDDGHILSKTDPLGRSWTFGYDAASRLIERSDPAGDSCEVAYDEAGRIAGLNYSLGMGLTIDRDPRSGRSVRKSFGDAGPVYRYVWNDRGDLEEIWRDDRLRQRIAHDDQGNPTRIELGDGRWQTMEFDPRGRLQRLSTDGGLQVTLHWDQAGKLVAAQRTGQPVESRAYDAEGNQLVREKGEARAAFTIGAWNVPITAVGCALRQPHTCAYDSENRLTELRHGSHGAHRFFYDLCGRVIAHRHPAGDVERFERDAAGRVTAIIDRLGRRVEFDYDPWGNISERRGADGVARWTFGSATDLEAHEVDAVACRFELDADGRPVAEIFAFADGPEIRVGFDDDGFFGLDEEQPRVRHHVDEEGRPSGLICSAWSGPVRYRPDRERLEIGYPNGVREVLQFDAAGRCLGQILIASTGLELNHRRYAYDDAGNLVGIDDTLCGDRRFIVDLADHLVAVERPGDVAGDERYVYDDGGNLSRDGERWTFDADRLVRRPGCSYAYDACGNRIEKRDSSGRTRYRYDARGRLLEVVLPNGQRVEYAYDAVGRRVYRRLGDLGTLFLWNSDNLVAERHSDGRRRLYIYHRGSRHLVGWVDTDAVTTRCYFVHNDHLGRPQEVTDEEGSLVWAADYDAFGNLRRLLVASVEQPFRSAGQYADAETGLYYSRHRYFDPDAARFLTEDPAGLDAGLNLYAYCPNPVVQTDPLGTCAGTNPAYDPRLAELEAIERIYEGSPGLQLLTQAHGSGDWQDTVRARQALEAETGFTVHPWTHPVGGRLPTPDDAGRVDWENRRVYIDPEVDDDTYRTALSHEFGALKVVNDDAAQRGMTPTGDWEEIKEEHIPPAARPNIITPYRTQVLDHYVRDPEGMTENLERDWENP